MPQGPFETLGRWLIEAGRQNPGLASPPPFPSGFPAQVQAAAGAKSLEWKGTAPNPPSTADDATFRQAIWTPGVYDLHSEFANDKSTLRQTAAPLLGGAGMYVYLRCKPNPDVHLQFLAISYYERVSAWGFNNMYAVTGEQDVSMNLLIGNPPHDTDVIDPTTGLITPEADPLVQGLAGFLCLRPPGDMGPIRYWQPFLVFNVWALMPDPDITLESGWY